MRIFYDVDTQNDFMLSTGRLYVPDAESIVGKVATLTNYARTNGIVILGSVDAHTADDPEFKVFPPHCVKCTLGQRKVMPAMETGEHYFEKQSYDIFTNPNFERTLLRREVKEAAVYGVATDFCVKAAVLGMQQRGVQCYVVEDAIRGVFPDKTKEALEQMTRAGARLVTTKQVLEGRV